jgi:hypothetical protein
MAALILDDTNLDVEDSQYGDMTESSVRSSASKLMAHGYTKAKQCRRTPSFSKLLVVPELL